jgi:hypothetical protein
MTDSISTHHLNVIETFDALESHIQKARELYSFYNIIDSNNPISPEVASVYRQYLSAISEEFTAFLTYYDSLVNYYNH